MAMNLHTLAASSLIIPGTSCDKGHEAPTPAKGNSPPPRVGGGDQRKHASPDGHLDEKEAPVRKLREPRPGAKPDPPVATSVPGKPGFVFSPFNNKIIDVSGLPGGSLVADPSYPSEEQKHFRLPEDEKEAP